MKERTNEDWLRELRAIGQVKEAAVADLHAIILSGLPYALSKWLSPNDPQFKSLSEDVAQDAVLRVLDKLDTFEGRSKFTTWVHKISIRIALTELRRQRWKDTSLDEILDAGNRSKPLWLLGDSSQNPELSTQQLNMLERIQSIIDGELTEKQRNAMIAISIHGIPIDIVARKMNMKRNALYKLMHDARLRLKNRLRLEGLSPEDILASFENR